MELSEAQEKYKDVELVFSYYYKYSFYTNIGETVTAVFGGDSHSIYRYEVTTGVHQTLGNNYECDWRSVVISNTFSWYE